MPTTSGGTHDDASATLSGLGYNAKEQTLIDTTTKSSSAKKSLDTSMHSSFSRESLDVIRPLGG